MLFTRQVGNNIIEMECGHPSHDLEISCCPTKLSLNGTRLRRKLQGTRRVFVGKETVVKIEPEIICSKGLALRMSSLNGSGVIWSQNMSEKERLEKILKEDAQHFPKLIDMSEHGEILLVSSFKGLVHPTVGFVENTLLGKSAYETVEKMAVTYGLMDLDHVDGNRFRNWAMKGKYPVILDLGR